MYTDGDLNIFLEQNIYWVKSVYILTQDIVNVFYSVYFSIQTFLYLKNLQMHNIISFFFGTH